MSTATLPTFAEMHTMTADELFEQHQDWAKSVARKYIAVHGINTARYLEGELETTALEGLWMSCLSMNGCGRSFRSFAEEKIVGEINMLLRDRKLSGRSKERPNFKPLSHVDPKSDDRSAHAMINDLEPDHRQICELLVGGYTYAEIGDRMGITERQVKYRMADIRNALGDAR